MKTGFALALLLAAGLAGAQTTYRWIDAAGTPHFTDNPPPAGAAKKFEAMKPGATAADQPQLPYEIRKAAQDFPVTLFVSEDCPPCQQGRDLLKQRGIPYAEKDVRTPDGAAAAKAILGDQIASVPVLSVGKQSTKGFLATQWNGLLDAAGYPAKSP